ncbi:MAG TPA: ABC transporter permease [Gaiellaceae bacterium]|jgi:ABC-2 type transport system permease protein|nr:ABC transporter permease [Gaiellaceae bacterium]
MRLFYHEVRAQQLLFWRNREAAIFTFFLPVIFFLIFASVYGNDKITKEGGIRAAAFLEAGMIGYGVAATCFAGLGITLVIRRETGIMKRIRATPLPAPTYLLAILASTFFVFLIEATLIIVSGRLFFRVGVPENLLSLIALLVIGAVCFAAMGLGITGFVRSAEGSSAVINAVYLPMAIISGTFFTPKDYPTFLRVIAEILPLTHYTEATRDVMVRDQHIWSDAVSLTVVFVWGVVGLVFALRKFKWQPVDAL